MNDERVPLTGFASTYHEFHEIRDQFAVEMCERGFGCWMDFHCDDYDGSVEFNKVKNGAKLPAKAQYFLLEQGFIKAYLNHEDGSETHYTWKRSPFKPDDGWRVNYRTREVNPWPTSWPAKVGDYKENPKL
jgi:hypothetical protein